MASPHLEELRSLARELVDAQHKAADLAHRFANLLVESRPPVADQLDPEIAEAMGALSHASERVAALIDTYARILMLCTLAVPKHVLARAVEAMKEGLAAARRRCTCAGCTADRAAAAQVAAEALERARVAAGGPPR